jgi:hypothetical protein
MRRYIVAFCLAASAALAAQMPALGSPIPSAVTSVDNVGGMSLEKVFYPNWEKHATGGGFDRWHAPYRGTRGWGFGWRGFYARCHWRFHRCYRWW